MRPSLSLHDITAVVVAAGRMTNAAKVRVTKQKYNSYIQKNFSLSRHTLVSDPTSSLRTGDVIRMATERHSRRIKHVVTAIVAPWGEPIAERPAILSREEREKLRAEKRARKVGRREGRREGEREGNGGEKEVGRKGVVEDGERRGDVAEVRLGEGEERVESHGL